MSLFDSFITNLKKKVDAENAYKQTVIEIVKGIVGITLTDEMIVSLKEGILTLSVSPTLKSIILLKQEKLLSEFSLQNLTVRSIR